MSNILITGCAGLIGSHLSRHLIEKGHTVTGIDDLSGGYEDWLPKSPQFMFLKQDLAESEHLESVFLNGNFDTVFHLAAYAAEGLSPFIRVFNYKNNVIASANIVNKCVNYNCKLVFTSSMAVYGNQKPPFVESMPCIPIDPYGNAKALIENDIKLAADQFGLRYSIVRPHNVIGTQQNIWDRYRNVLGIFIRRTITGLPMQIYGSGEQKRAFSDIRFYLNVFEQLIRQHDGETFNVGSDSYITINELALIVHSEATKLGLKPSIEHLEPRHEAFEAFCDHSKAKQMLAFDDQTSIRTTTREMLEWALTQPDRPVLNMKYEINKGIYSYWK